MQYAASTAQREWAEGSIRQLVLPWPSLSNIVSPVGGNQMMAVAAPGVGKTAFALNMAAGIQEPVLFLSADTDPKLMGVQLSALASGDSRPVVEDRLRNSAEWRSLYSDAIRQEYPHLVMDFTPAPRLDRIEDQCVAMCEVWGEPPKLIVIDTASDVIRSGEGFQAWQEQWIAGRELSRRLNVVVFWLHHVTEGPVAGGKIPPEQNDGMYKSDQFVEVWMGLHHGEGKEMICTVQKNRGGKAKVPVTLIADHERAEIREPERKGEDPSML